MLAYPLAWPIAEFARRRPHAAAHVERVLDHLLANRGAGLPGIERFWTMPPSAGPAPAPPMARPPIDIDTLRRVSPTVAAYAAALAVIDAAVIPDNHHGARRRRMSGVARDMLAVIMPDARTSTVEALAWYVSAQHITLWAEGRLILRSDARTALADGLAVIDFGELPS